MKKIRWGRFEIISWGILRKQCNIGIHLWWGGKDVSLELYFGPIKMEIRWKKKLETMFDMFDRWSPEVER